MRLVAAIVTVLLVVAGIVLLVRPGSGSGGAAAPVSGSGAPEGEGAGQVVSPGASSMSEEEREALAALRAEIARAAPVAHRSDEERLAEAHAWVAANRPADRPYNEIEAQILALMDVLVDGDKRSAEWAMNMSQIEIEMIRAIDADSDGQVTDAEVQRFIDDNIASMFNPMEHPYLQEKFDTDGDGQINPDEMTGFANMMTDGALAGAIERGKLDAWDTDKDGFINDGERAAGEESAYKKAAEMLSSMIPEGAGKEFLTMSDEDIAALEPEAAAQANAVRSQLDAAKDMMASQLAAQELMEAMRLDNLEQPDQAEILKEMPQPPTDPMVFDSDGDGSLSEVEMADHQDAMLGYQEEVQRWGAELTAYRLQAQFENAAGEHDLDRDGRLSDAEWETRIGELLDAREERLFLREYDLDGSGRVDPRELERFVDWYRAGSLRADANFDGRVDGADLQEVMIDYQSQGG